MVYCPYTDSELDPQVCSSEHIVPLALGGTNGFEIAVSAAFNSKVGAEIDGALANDFLTLTKRNRYDIRGHTRKRPLHIVKNARDAETGAPLQVHLDQVDGLKVWDPKDKRFITENRPNKLSLNFQIDLDLHFRFTAKVALAAGYFAYGDLFRTAVKHNDFRAIMNHPSGATTDRLSGVEAQVDSLFYQTKSPKLEAMRRLCKASQPYSLVALVPSSNRFSAFVGVLGDYIGMLSVPADGSKLPNEGAYRWGHVIQLYPGKGMARLSLMEVFTQALSSSSKWPGHNTPESS